MCWISYYRRELWKVLGVAARGIMRSQGLTEVGPRDQMGVLQFDNGVILSAAVSHVDGSN